VLIREIRGCFFIFQTDEFALFALTGFIHPNLLFNSVAG
jgi:hypothetical protein